MKQLFLITLLSVSAVCSQAQEYEVTTDDHSGAKMFRGQITDSLLKIDTAFKWFAEAQKVYDPKPQAVKALKDYKDNISFTVFMGTWCGDSHFVVPRFYKIVEAAGFDKNKISMIAVDRTKKDKNNEADSLHITNVPTIIVYKSGKELGRVVEYGTTGRFDEELAAIINKG